MNNFRELRVWRKAVELATTIYKTERYYPHEETYGLKSQMRRCAVSISSNIAEGAGRGTKNEFRHFLNMAYGSSFELETQLIISKNLTYLSDENFKELSNDLIEIQKMLYSLIKSVSD